MKQNENFAVLRGGEAFNENLRANYNQRILEKVERLHKPAERKPETGINELETTEAGTPETLPESLPESLENSEAVETVEFFGNDEAFEPLPSPAPVEFEPLSVEHSGAEFEPLNIDFGDDGYELIY